MEPPKLIFSKFGEKSVVSSPSQTSTDNSNQSVVSVSKAEKPKEFKYKVLIVDDEKALSRVLKLKLNSLGVEVDTAFNGLEALEFIKNNKYDLIVLDIVMPVMGGFEVLEELKKLGKKLNILVSTSLSQPEDKQKAMSFGAEYINKGSTPLSKMVNTIFDLINKNGSK